MTFPFSHFLNGGFRVLLPWIIVVNHLKWWNHRGPVFLRFIHLILWCGLEQEVLPVHLFYFFYFNSVYLIWVCVVLVRVSREPCTENVQTELKCCRWCRLKDDKVKKEKDVHFHCVLYSTYVSFVHLEHFYFTFQNVLCKEMSFFGVLEMH